jgi:RNA polymerase sigma-70 factor (ECF subfamily)
VVGRPLTEAELVERAKRGDQDAYGDLMHAYQGIAFRTAYLLTGNAADAEEAAQSAFVKAFYALGRFRPGAELRPWLLRIVANEARNRRRSRCAPRRLSPRGARPRPPRHLFWTPSATPRCSRP